MVKYGVGFFDFDDFDPIGSKIDFLRYQVTHNQNKFPYQIHHQEHDASIEKCSRRPLVVEFYASISLKSTFSVFLDIKLHTTETTFHTISTTRNTMQVSKSALGNP